MIKTCSARQRPATQRLHAACWRATALLALLLPFSVHALDASRPAVSIYQGQGVDSNLMDLPGNAVQGDLVWDSTYLTGIGYLHPLPTPRLMQSLFDTVRLSETRTAAEVIVVKHYGLQHNWEANLAYMLRFPQLQTSYVSVRAGVGLGFSYAFGTPSYEDGPKFDPERRYRWQNYNAYELEWTLPAFPRTALLTRIHHRSGIYGIIAPRRVGSNFLTLGVRRTF
jgi:hypothetical protein